MSLEYPSHSRRLCLSRETTAKTADSRDFGPIELNSVEGKAVSVFIHFQRSENPDRFFQK